MNRFRRDLRCTIADFSIGRMPKYEIDTFSTPEGTLGIKLFPQVRLGTKPDEITTTKTSTNIYWFCKHLEQSGWLVKECFIGEEPVKEPIVAKPRRITIKTRNDTTSLQAKGYDIINYTWSVSPSCVTYIVVRKIDESDIEPTKTKVKSK